MSFLGFSNRSSRRTRLRTPLTVIRSVLEIPLHHGDVPECLRPFIGRAPDAVRKSEAIIEVLLQLARSDELANDRRAVELASILDAILHNLEVVIQRRGVSVSCDVASEQVWAEPTLLQIVVRPIVENAIFHNVGGGNVSIMIERREAEVLFIVENDGETFNPSDVEILLNPFFKAGRKRIASPDIDRGFGLGLAMVRNISQASEWNLLIKARCHGGLSVSIALPSADGPPH